MAKKRITELATETTLKDGQYVAIDHTTDGTKKLNLGAELTNLKEDLEGLNANIANGSPTLLVFDWTRGENWKNGNDVFVANINYRVCNSNPFSYPVDLKITHTGYAIKLFMDTNHDGTYATTIPWWKDPYTIPANTPTYISIKRITEDTSETAIIDDFVNALEVSPIIAKENEFQDVKKVIYESNYVSVTADDSVVGKYIGKDGGVSDLARYTILCFYLDKNDVLRIKSSNGVSDVSVIAFISVWQNDVFQYVYGDSVDGSETDDIFIANENCEVRVVTRNNNSSYSYSFYKAKYALASSNYIEKLIQKNSEVKASILSAFKNITCIGDSLTWSQVYTGASSSRQAFTPYPKVIEALTGVTATILATAGYSAVDNWSEYNDDMVQKDGQLAIVYLGTNEGLTDTIDTDMVGDDYTQWSNTNTGCYGKIIAKLLSVNSRVVLVKVHSSSGNVTTTNTVIDKMGTKFNVPVISNEYLSGAKYHSYPDGSGTNGTHYNDIGYAVFARQIIDKISTLSDADILKILPL